MNNLSRLVTIMIIS